MNDHPPHNEEQPQVVQTPRRQRHKRSKPQPQASWKFRSEFILVPAIIAMIAWLSKGAEPSMSWDEFMATIGIRDTDRYTRLVALGLIGTAMALCYRMWKRA